ncbi:baeRF3 domain-containing protein [Raoultibacter phocaeensis]|uniref:baeRF3 domain-containing protein n=1 Tax=Raoultibacter phocaeensis TaxID=2479841 RepID=UPI001117B283|nr:hypothetical protein [Raoultibacter phocaeensis]
MRPDLSDITVSNEFDPALFANHEGPLVSLYMTTHRHAPENRQDPIRYKNLVTETKSLFELNYDRKDYEGILEPLDLLETYRDADIWRKAKDGLAVLASNDGMTVYKLDYPVDEFVSVTDTFHIKPLIRNFQFGSHYYLVAIDENGFQVFEGDFHSIEKLEMPDGIETEFRKEFDDYTNALTGMNGHQGSHSPTYHRYGDKSEVGEKDTEEHFRYAAKAIEDAFAKHRLCPIILVGLPENQAIFRAVASIPTLLEENIDKPIASMDEKEVLERAVAIITGVQEARIGERVERFGTESSQGRASSDPREIAHALVERKVEVLFIEQDLLIPGSFDAETGALSYGADMLDASDDITDDLAQATYLQGGEVYVLPKERMPADTGTAALYRY